MALASSNFAFAPGSARVVHLVYPPPYGSARQDNASSGTGLLVHYGSGTSGMAISIGGSGTSTTLAIANPANSVPVRLRTTALANDVAQIQFGNAFPLIERLPTTIPVTPSYSYRLIVIAAFQALPGALGANQDLGLEILPGNVSTMNVGATRPGIMFGPTDATHIGLRIRQTFGGGFTLDRELTFAQAGVSNISNWNVFELRMVSAVQAGVGGVLRAFVNGVPFGAAVDMSTPAGIFPVLSQAGGGFNGFCYRITNGNVGNLIAGTYDFFFNEAHLIVSPTEDNSG